MRGLATGLAARSRCWLPRWRVGRLAGGMAAGLHDGLSRRSAGGLTAGLATGLSRGLRRGCTRRLAGRLATRLSGGLPTGESVRLNRGLVGGLACGSSGLSSGHCSGTCRWLNGINHFTSASNGISTTASVIPQSGIAIDFNAVFAEGVVRLTFFPVSVCGSARIGPHKRPFCRNIVEACPKGFNSSTEVICHKQTRCGTIHAQHLRRARTGAECLTVTPIASGRAEKIALIVADHPSLRASDTRRRESRSARRRRCGLRRGHSRRLDCGTCGRRRWLPRRLAGRLAARLGRGLSCGSRRRP